MSRAQEKSQAKQARQVVTSWIDEFYRSKLTPHGGLILGGEMQKLDMNAEMADLAAPELIDFQKGLALKHQLFDFFGKGDKRLLVLARTFVGNDELCRTGWLRSPTR